MKACAVPVDWDKYWKDKLKEKKEDIYFLRGFFIDKSIDIENKLIYIIAQYCSEDLSVYNVLGYTLMKKELFFSTLIRIFNNSNILRNFNKIKMKQKEINEFKKKLIEIPEIRNKFAHWIHVNSENSIYNSDDKKTITEELLIEYYNKFSEVDKILDKINTSFLEWDDSFVMFKDWSHTKTKQAHKDRIKQIKDLIKKELGNKYDKLVKQLTDKHLNIKFIVI